MNVKLIIFREDGRRREFVLRKGATTIGRKEDCDIRIPLATVSRRHAEFIVEEDGAMIRDLGASNGTYLNNQRIAEEDLEPGDRVIVGPVVFTVQIDGDPADGEIEQVRTKVPSEKPQGPASVGTSKHVYAADDDDPISALEALASSADQTAITPEEDD